MYLPLWCEECEVDSRKIEHFGCQLCTFLGELAEKQMISLPSYLRPVRDQSQIIPVPVHGTAVSTWCGVHIPGTWYLVHTIIAIIFSWKCEVYTFLK